MAQQTSLQALRVVVGEEENDALEAAQEELGRTRLDLERTRMMVEDYAGGTALFRPGYSWRDANDTLQRIVRDTEDRIDRALDVAAGSPGGHRFDEQVEAMVAILEGDE